MSRRLRRWAAEKGMVPVAATVVAATALLVLIATPVVQYFRVLEAAVASVASRDCFGLKKTFAGFVRLQVPNPQHKGEQAPGQPVLEPRGKPPQPRAQEPVAIPCSAAPAELKTEPVAVTRDVPSEEPMDVAAKGSFVVTSQDAADADYSAPPKNAGSMAVITHGANPVTQLSVSDVRNLLTGRFTNWKQVGGDDSPVTVITGRDEPDIAQLLFKVPVAKDAARLPFLSLVIPSVSGLKNAVGFLPIRDFEQLGVVSSQQGIKLISIKCREQSPAVILSRMSVWDGSYPLRFLP